MYTNIQFSPVFQRKTFIALVTGTPDFVERTVAVLHSTKRVLVSVELNRLKSDQALT